MDILLNTIACNEHIPEIKWYNRTIKDWVHSAFRTFSFQQIPHILTVYIAVDITYIHAVLFLLPISDHLQFGVVPPLKHRSAAKAFPGPLSINAMSTACIFGCSQRHRDHKFECMCDRFLCINVLLQPTIRLVKVIFLVEHLPTSRLCIRQYELTYSSEWD